MILRVYLLIFSTVLSSCQEGGDQRAASEESAQLEAIVGTWKSDAVDGGRFKKFIVMTFTGDGRVITKTELINIHTDEIKGTAPMEGAYLVSDGIIHRTIKEGFFKRIKAEIPYSIEGARMRLTLGRENYTLKRQAEQDEALKP